MIGTKFFLLENNSPNESFNAFFDEIDSLVNKHLPLTKLTKNEVKGKFKPWISIGIRNSMKRRDKLYNKWIKAKNPDIKNEYQIQYDALRNLIETLCRESKKLYYQNYFYNNANNIKNTWKGINQIININSKGKNRPSSLIVKNKLISDPYEVANNFNEYFSTIADKLQANIYQVGSDSSQYLTNMNEHNFFIKPDQSYRNNKYHK